MPIATTADVYNSGTEIPLPEKTGPQLFGSADYGPQLLKETGLGSAFYKKVRRMRRHPTVKLARALAVAPLLAAEWSAEAKDGAPNGAQEFIDQQVMPHRTNLLRTSLHGCMDYGWQPYEKVLKLVRQDSQLKFGIQKLKPLLQDVTDILINRTDGSYAGLYQNLTREVTLTVSESLTLAVDVEGTQWYGEPDSKAVEPPFDWWEQCNEANLRYDRRIAGAHWIIYYPPGKSEFAGKTLGNFEIAIAILSQLESSTSAAIPSSIENWVDDANKNVVGWKLDIIAATGDAQTSFVGRLKYLDALICRAYGLPERAVLEGQFGTKAEAEAHADFAITNMELRHRIMVESYNKHLVNHLLELNYGEEAKNTVKICVAPLVDAQLQQMKSVYTSFLSNTDGFAQEMDRINTDAIKEKLGIPMLSEEDILANEEAALARLRNQPAPVPPLLPQPDPNAPPQQ